MNMMATWWRGVRSPMKTCCIWPGPDKIFVISPLDRAPKDSDRCIGGLTTYGLAHRRQQLRTPICGGLTEATARRQMVGSPVREALSAKVISSEWDCRCIGSITRASRPVRRASEGRLREALDTADRSPLCAVDRRDR